MENQKVLDYLIVVFVGSTLVILFVVFFIVLLISYQKRIFKKQLIIEKQNVEFQNKLILKINETQEQERERIAKDVHDEVSILFSFAKVKLQEITSLNTNHKLDVLLLDVQNAISTGIDGLRRALNLIYPSLFIEFGFIKSIEILVNLLNSNNLLINIKVPEKPLKLTENVELSLFRIIQELLNNAIKHSKADKIDISFDIDESNLFIIVEDNGIGFNETEVTKGLGLSSIRNRILVINGSIKFDSIIGFGTKCSITLPR